MLLSAENSLTSTPLNDGQIFPPIQSHLSSSSVEDVGVMLAGDVDTSSSRFSKRLSPSPGR
ncbi:hypothetical protein NQZ68_028280 [Dissostichus eleginoides]|nr:hypothetical protein NQZ68_028280 [Dissostichus eleginoides]